MKLLTEPIKLTPMRSKSVRCETRNEVELILSLYELAGWRWANGDKPRAYYPGNKATIEINPSFRYCSNSPGLSVKEFIKLQNIKI